MSKNFKGIFNIHPPNYKSLSIIFASVKKFSYSFLFLIFTAIACINAGLSSAAPTKFSSQVSVSSAQLTHDSSPNSELQNFNYFNFASQIHRTIQKDPGGLTVFAYNTRHCPTSMSACYQNRGHSSLKTYLTQIYPFHNFW